MYNTVCMMQQLNANASLFYIKEKILWKKRKLYVSDTQFVTENKGSQIIFTCF